MSPCYRSTIDGPYAASTRVRPVTHTANPKILCPDTATMQAGAGRITERKSIALSISF